MTAKKRTSGGFVHPEQTIALLQAYDFFSSEYKDI